MGKRLPSTPRSKVRAALRKLSLRSRERSAALKRDHYICQVCGVKQSKRKGHEVQVECHHRDKEILWDVLIDTVYEMLLVHPDSWITLCKDCHKKEHNEKG